MKRHRQAAHGGARNSFLCDQCEYATSQHASLKRHLRAMHGGGGAVNKRALDLSAAIFRCELCSFRARWSRSVRRHRLAVHDDSVSGGRAYACQHCPYRASQVGTLSRHVRLVHQHKTVSMMSAVSESRTADKPGPDAVELAMVYSDIKV